VITFKDGQWVDSFTGVPVNAETVQLENRHETMSRVDLTSAINCRPSSPLGAAMDLAANIAEPFVDEAQK
jgi:hypothetical protein